MATGSGIIRKLRGKVGDLVYRVRDGEQVVSAYNPQVKNPRTTAQMALVRMPLTKNICK